MKRYRRWLNLKEKGNTIAVECGLKEKIRATERAEMTSLVEFNWEKHLRKRFESPSKTSCHYFKTR
jgi:hypothetical protein